MAGVLGVASTRLANYELGRVPLPFSIAEKLNEKFQINFEWLAEGKGGMASIEPFHRAKTTPLSPIALFSRIYFDEIKTDLSDERASGRVSIVAIGAPMFVASLQRIIARSAASLHPSLLLPYARHLIRESHRFLEKAVTQFESEQKKEGLPSVNRYDNSDSVTRPPIRDMESLLMELRRRTSAHGKKAELSRFMKVPLPTISRWLAGDVTPGGQATLRLLKWVEAVEEPSTITKSPGSATNTTRAKTRSKATSHENIRPSPPKA